MGAREAMAVESASRELDLVVFRLETRPDGGSVDRLLEERKEVRRELERLRDELVDIARRLE